MKELQWLLDVLVMAEAFRRRRQAAGVVQGQLCLLYFLLKFVHFVLFDGGNFLVELADHS